LFFAAVNDEHISSDARDIARYIKEGHRMAEVPVEEVRSCQWCTCNDDEQANTSSNGQSEQHR
jgi:hypothetical protein